MTDTWEGGVWALLPIYLLIISIHLFIDNQKESSDDASIFVSLNS